MYCTLWELGQDVNTPSSPTEVERKGLNLWCDITIYTPTKNKLIYQIRANTYDFWLSGQYGKYISNIFLLHPLSPFPSKMPLNSLFWSPPTAVHKFDAWEMAVPGLYISWPRVLRPAVHPRMDIQSNKQTNRD